MFIVSCLRLTMVDEKGPPPVATAKVRDQLVETGIEIRSGAGRHAIEPVQP
jgi:hypothetical protein